MNVKWKDEIADFAKVVEDFTGNKVTPEKLAEAINLATRSFTPQEGVGRAIIVIYQ